MRLFIKKDDPVRRAAFNKYLFHHEIMRVKELTRTLNNDNERREDFNNGKSKNN